MSKHEIESAIEKKTQQVEQARTLHAELLNELAQVEQTISEQEDLEKLEELKSKILGS